MAADNYEEMMAQRKRNRDAYSAGSFQGGTALQFVPCSKMEAEAFVRENT